ncbi:hypothetical protein AB0K48_34460 [Nonomuraea sp. NPDC055795]
MPYRAGPAAWARAAAARASVRSGSSAGSGLPRDRSRAPGGTWMRMSSRAVLAGRGLTREPRRPAVSTTPRSRSRR